MMTVALGMVAAAAVVVILLPVNESMIWPILIMLVVVSIAVFLGKSVILAPIAELNLPEGISGSAMSVGSFLAYASVFWGYTLNGSMLDANAADPAAGYHRVFLITALVAAIGAICAGLLIVLNRRASHRDAAREAAISASVDEAIEAQEDRFAEDE